MGKLTKFAKKIIPAPMIEPLRRLYSHIVTYKQRKREVPLIKEAPLMHSKALDKVRSKGEPFNVVFFALMDSVWKYDRLYNLMEDDPRYNPTILVCPIVNYGKENMLRNLYQCYDYYKNKGYNVILSYDEKSDTYLDVRSELNPDIIFYTNPYRGLIDDRYYIDKFQDILTCYVSYFFGNTNLYSTFYDTLVHNLSWAIFTESNRHSEYIKLGYRQKHNNTVMTGYPGIEYLLSSNKSTPKYDESWKICSNKMKKIIWAPHHSLFDSASYSSFMSYNETFFQLASKFRDKIQIAFKPHPLLRNKLYDHWGKEKTDEYYDRWKNLENGTVVDGAYENLFITSDALIHDSGSFMIEYIFANKPVLRLENGCPSHYYGDFAKECLALHEHAYSAQDIEEFIVSVINGEDSNKEKRTKFIESYKDEIGGDSPSNNIMNYINGQLGLSNK